MGARGGAREHANSRIRGYSALLPEQKNPGPGCRAGNPSGHSAKSLLREVGCLKAPSKIYEKTSDVGLLGGVGEKRVVLGAPCRRTSRLLGCFRSHLMGVPRWGAEPLAERLLPRATREFEFDSDSDVS